MVEYFGTVWIIIDRLIKINFGLEEENGVKSFRF